MRLNKVIAILLPIAPALLLSISLQAPIVSNSGWPVWLAWPASLFIGLMFETAGYATGTAYQKRIRMDGVFNLNLLFITVYVVAVVAIVFYASVEIKSYLMRSLMVAFPLISIGAYISSIASEDADARKAEADKEQAKTDRIAAEQAAFERQRIAERDAFERDQKRLANEVTANNRAVIAQAKAAQIAHFDAQIAHPNAQSNVQTNVQGLTDNQQSIMQAIAQGATTQAQIVRETGLHRNTVHNNIDVLRGRKIVHKNGQGLEVMM